MSATAPTAGDTVSDTPTAPPDDPHHGRRWLILSVL